MKKIYTILLILLLCGCGATKSKKIKFLSKSNSLIVKSIELSTEVYLDKHPDRKSLDKRLNDFLEQSNNLETISGWDKSDTIKNKIIDFYKLDITENQLLDSLNEDLYRGLMGGFSTYLKQNLIKLCQDELDKLKIED